MRAWLVLFGMIVGGVSSASAASADSADAAAELRELIELHVAAGFLSRADIEELAVEFLSEEHPESKLRPKVKPLTRELLAAHQRAQAAWPKMTDCDRLDAAFRELEAAGVIARQNFSDCGTCGVAEISDEMAAAQKRGKKLRGYTFYHQQGTESAVTGGILYLSYGAAKDDVAASVAIGREVAEALQRQGLTVVWDGTIEKRVGVKMDWKRRR